MRIRTTNWIHGGSNEIPLIYIGQNVPAKKGGGSLLQELRVVIVCASE
jgi:hypothetical protein